jgi:hypothetical protein
MGLSDEVRRNLRAAVMFGAIIGGKDHLQRKPLESLMFLDNMGIREGT